MSNVCECTSTETIEIKMDYGNPLIFNAGRFIAKHGRLFTLNDDHFKVIEKYRVQFDVKGYCSYSI
ncbi:2597_t:CDS:2 [Diversispora eburnea]|uniref:2597_t:CDS:1 n=1 Tax=Diversispora eburnea TaxID=1213867 RepID=A0A9N8WUB1_9GLOM|nr:2597_t:CDS:2 [Diversispora eburnea]